MAWPKKSAAQIWRPAGLPIDFFKANGFEHCYDRHTHDEFAIGAMEFGVQQFYCMRGQNFAVTRGLITINPDELHDGHEANGGRLTYRMMYIDPNYFRSLAAEFSKRANGIPFFGQPFAADEELSREFLKVHALFDRNQTDVHCALERDSRLVELLVQMIKRHVKVRLPEDNLTLDKRRVERAQQYMKDAFAERVTLADLAGRAGLSRYHFLRMFKAVVGMAPHAYLCQLRLNRARKILQSGAPKISDVAQDTGFFDQSHFTHKFKSAFGVTPSHYAARCSSR